MKLLLAPLCAIGSAAATVPAAFGGAFASPSATATVDLGGDAWTLTNGSMTPVKATVPGQTHTDLLAAGVIGDPYNNTNSDLQRWVALSNWTYERTFSVSPELLAHRNVQLVSLGIDTIATIYINDHHVFDTDNMFHRIRLDAKPFLEAGSNNSIRVHFTSKVIEAGAREAACDNATSIVCPSGARSAVQHGFDSQNYIRTEPCSFSWDWGPGFAPMGLWRPIYLQAYDDAVVRDITVVTTPGKADADIAAARMQDPRFSDPADALDPTDKSEAALIARAFQRTDRQINETVWDADVTVYVDAGVNDAASETERDGQIRSGVAGEVLVSFNGSPAVSSGPVVVPAGQDLAVHVPLKGLTGISPWMPNGFGTQTLYNISAQFVANHKQNFPAVQHYMHNGFEVPYLLEDNAIKGADGSWSVRVGFRTVELVQDPLPGGKSYYFRVTGVPIPVKGSNWIPADAFESRISRNEPGTTRLEPIFWALRDSHQNMIRNWGGGIYQRDSFYDLADENGILIWEDLMFACADYAAPPEFLASAAKEIRDNVLRLQSHPSIALWAGNNEDERDMKNAPAGDTSPEYVKAYSLLTFITGLNNVSALDTSRPLSGSSPSDGNETAEHPFSWDHQSEYYGDVHCYLYDVDNWDVTAYKRPRFMSEFGLQSWPSALTMGQVFPPEQWSFSSDMSTNRNHHPQGQSQMAQQISMHFHLPQDCWPECGTPTNKEYSDWSQMLWLSQLNQALGYKAEVEHFRRIRTDCSENVPGCNMGRMYWQTNDIWQGASWAAVDFTGRYKMVQYFTRKFYEPFLVSAWGTAVHGSFGVSVINDFVDQAFSGTVEFTMRRWSGGVAGKWTVPFTAPAGSATYVYSEGNLTFTQMLQKGNCNDATTCVLTFRALDAAGTELSSNYLLLAPFYDVTTMQQPQLQAGDVVQLPDGSQGARAGETPFNVTVESQSSATAAFVWVETRFAGRWSDNAFLMVDPETSLTFFSDNAVNGNITAAQLKTSLENAGSWGGVVQQKMGQGGIWSLADTSAEYTSKA